MEHPNPAKRWDQPLFEVRDEEEMPFEKIYDAILNSQKNKPRDPVSTKTENTFDANFIYELDKSCQKVIDIVLKE